MGEKIAAGFFVLLVTYLFGTCLYERPCGGGIYAAPITAGEMERSENARLECINRRYSKLFGGQRDERE